MAKKNAKNENEVKESIRVLDEHHKKMIRAIIENKRSLLMDQEAIKDDVKAVAERLGLTTGEINKIVNLIMKEEDKGGVIKAETDTINLAEQVLDAPMMSDSDEPAEE